MWLFDIIHAIGEQPVVASMFTQNSYLYLHILGGGLLGFWFRQKHIWPCKKDWWAPVALMFFVALAWELFEMIYETSSHVALVSVYGTTLRYWCDTGGDILGFLTAFFLSYYHD
mgnify:CR=1 FL=1